MTESWKESMANAAVVAFLYWHVKNKISIGTENTYEQVEDNGAHIWKFWPAKKAKFDSTEALEN